MKSKFIILLLGSLILFSDCNPFKNLGKTKDERRTERKQKRAKRLVNKAIKVDPSILSIDTIYLPGASIDSSFSVDSSINFVDSIVDRLLHNLDDWGNNSAGNSRLDIEYLKEWAINALKDSIRLRDLIKDTITHRFLRNGVAYRMKIWDKNGRIYYGLDQGERMIFDSDVIIKELNFWEKHNWWIKILFWLVIILLVAYLLKEKLKQYFNIK